MLVSVLVSMLMLVVGDGVGVGAGVGVCCWWWWLFVVLVLVLVLMCWRVGGCWCRRVIVAVRCRSAGSFTLSSACVLLPNESFGKTKRT